MAVKFKKIKEKFLSRGVSLVEVVVGTAVLFLAITGLLTAYNYFIRAGVKTLGSVQSSYLLEEGIEAVSSIRDAGWSSNISGLSASGTYYLAWVSGHWTATSTVLKIDDTFSRYFNLASVYRDSNDNIASSGTLDSGTRKLTVYVSWPSGATTTLRSMSAYLTNLFNN